MAESAVRKAERNDFAEVCACVRVRVPVLQPQQTCLTYFSHQVALLLRTLSSPFVTQEAAEEAGYAAKPPAWARRLKVSCSS